MALKPGGRVIGLAARLGIVSAAGGLSFLVDDWKLGALVVLVGLVALMLLAAGRLQHQHDDWQEPRFTCTHLLQQNASPLEVNACQYRHAFMAYVEVRNDGPGARFEARINEITGVPAEWQPYRVPEPTWRNHASSWTTIGGHGGLKFIQVASILDEPRACWFWTSEDGVAPRPGHQMLIPRGEPANIEFVLEIVRTTSASELVTRWRGQILIPANVYKATFTLDKIPPATR